MGHFIGAVVLFTAAFALGYHGGAYGKNTLLAECEKTLPRNQHCVLRAEPAPQSGEKLDE